MVSVGLRVSASAAHTEPRYPRLLRRVRAILIDSVIVSLILLSWWLLFPLLENLPPALRIAYPILAIFLVDPVMVSMTGASPGHHLMGINIEDAKTGKTIGIFRAVVRSLLRGLFGWFSLIFVLSSRKHQALHDFVCRTSVVLRNPASLPAREKLFERNPEASGFRYPSKSRRVLVIVIYLILNAVIAVAISAALMSEDCLSFNRCGLVDISATLILNGALLFGSGAIIVLGWTGRLFGCRRSEDAGQSS